MGSARDPGRMALEGTCTEVQYQGASRRVVADCGELATTLTLMTVSPTSFRGLAHREQTHYRPIWAERSIYLSPSLL